MPLRVDIGSVMVVSQNKAGGPNERGGRKTCTPIRPLGEAPEC